PMTVNRRNKVTVAGILLAAVGLVAPLVSTSTADAGTRPNTSASQWLPPTPGQWPVVVNESNGPTETITRGLTHHSEVYSTVGGAQRAQVLDADMTDANLRLGVVEAGDHLTDP